MGKMRVVRGGHLTQQRPKKTSVLYVQTIVENETRVSKTLRAKAASIRLSFEGNKYAFLMRSQHELPRFTYMFIRNAKSSFCTALTDSCALSVIHYNGL